MIHLLLCWIYGHYGNFGHIDDTDDNVMRFV